MYVCVWLFKIEIERGIRRGGLYPKYYVTLTISMDLILVLISIIAVMISLYSVWRVGLIEEGLVLEVEQSAQGLRQHIDAELEPLVKNVNRAFGFKAQQAGDAVQLKKAEGMIMKDVLDTQDPILMGLLDMVSPATKEYLEENPSLIVELIPRLQSLSSVEGFSIFDLLKPPGDASPGRKHPFSSEE